MKITYSNQPNPIAKAFAKAIESVEAEIEFRKLTVVEELLQFMKRQGIKKGELAKRMGVGNSRITAMLSGDSNLTIDTLVRAGRAVDADLVQTFVPRGQKGVWVSKSNPNSKDQGCILYNLTPQVKPHQIDLNLETSRVAKEDSDCAA